VGVPHRRARRLRRPLEGRGAGRRRHGRVADPAGIRRLHRPAGGRPAPDHPAVDRDHPAGWAELRGRRQRRHMGELERPPRLRHA
jgi:hypothetical protein